MKFKSALGFAALEELTEDKAPEAGAGEGGEAKTDGAAAAATAAAPAGDEAAAAAAAAPASDATATTEPAPAAAPAADTAAAAAPAADGTDAAAAAPAVAEAGTGEAAAAAPAADASAAAPTGDDAAAAANADTAEAAQTAAAAAGAAEATGEPAAVVAEVAVDAGDAEAAEVEGEMEAVDKLEEQAGDVGEDVEKLEAATESLEGCVQILDAAAQRGGLDIFGASLLRNNVNTVTKSLKVKNLMLPALEDLETPSAKIDGANTAKEQLIAFIKRVINAIKEAFERLGTWIVETYSRLTNAFSAIEQRALKLEERLKGASMKTGALENKALAKQMSIGGAISSDVAGDLKGIGDLAKYLNDPKTYRQYLEVCDLCEDMVKNPEKAEEIRGKIAGVVSRWSEDIGKHAVDLTKAARSNAALSGASAKETESSKVFLALLFNNQALTLHLPESAEGLSNMASFTIELNEAPGSSVNALDAKAAAEVCKTVAAIAKELRESAEANKGGVKEITAEIKKRKDVITAMASALSDQMLKEAGVGEKVRKVIMFVNSFFMSAPKLPIHAINRAMPRNLNFALDYVAASMAGVAAAAPAAAAPAQLAA